MKKINAFYFIAFLLCASCAGPKLDGYYYERYTPFQKSIIKGGEGYHIYSSQVGNHTFYFSLFKGNTRTPSDIVRAYVRAAAINHCDQFGQLAVLTTPVDYSKIQKKVGSYSTGGYNIGNYAIPSTVHVYDYEIKTPIFIMPFMCRKFIKSTTQEVKFTQVDPLLIKEFVKDFQGGVLVKNDKGAKNLMTGDVILKVGKKRVTKPAEITALYDTQDDLLDLTLIRNQQVQRVQVPLLDNTAILEKSLTGVKKATCILEFTMIKEINRFRRQQARRTYNRKKQKYTRADFQIPFCRKGMNTKSTMTI